MQRTGGVSRNILKQNALAFKGVARAVSGTLTQHVAYGTHFGFLREAEIDKARTGNLNVGEDVAESGILLHGFDQSGGKFTGVLTGFLGALQCDGTGKITVTGLLGAFKADGFL